ncbi:MAG: flagellar assembly protein T N-terminal domain-containing protein [Colwellia sp.]
MSKYTSTYLFKVLFACLYLVLCPSAYATWYQGTAQQQIVGITYDLNAIRTSTIKQAITNATLKSGAYISLESIVLDGLLQSSKSVYKNKGDIRRVEILSETINDDILTVRVKVDINTSMFCSKDDYTKSIMLAQFPLLNTLQAVNGDLFDLGNQISSRLAEQLSKYDTVSDVQLLDKSFDSIKNLRRFDQQSAIERAYFLATKYRSQFIAFGFIQDISLFEQVEDNLLIDDITLRRNFTFQLFLYDALQGEILIDSRYHGEANWVFNEHEKIDTNNSMFWRSDYGRVVLNTLNSAVIDIDDSLNCQTTLSQIVNNQQDRVTINLGKKNGVKIADEFEVISRQLIHDNQNNAIPMLIRNKNITLHVKYVNSNSAVLMSNDPIINSNLLFDLVSPKGTSLDE